MPKLPPEQRDDETKPDPDSNMGVWLIAGFALLIGFAMIYGFFTGR